MKDADTIWDEAGMSSKRIFQLVNAIHHEIAEEKDARKPFGSKQIILVGEFLQLKPVPGTFDEGEFMLHLFRVAIPHRFELKELMRQNLADKTFTTALKELCLGICSPEMEALLKSLDKPLEGEAVDIFFTKISLQLHNQKALFRMSGELLTFDCVDKGSQGYSKLVASTSSSGPTTTWSKGKEVDFLDRNMELAYRGIITNKAKVHGHELQPGWVAVLVNVESNEEPWQQYPTHSEEVEAVLLGPRSTLHFCKPQQGKNHVDCRFSNNTDWRSLKDLNSRTTRQGEARNQASDPCIKCAIACDREFAKKARKLKRLESKAKLFIDKENQDVLEKISVGDHLINRRKSRRGLFKQKILK
ncbi:hypothetical protein ACROYT_G014962 [Oculina patagonica]